MLSEEPFRIRKYMAGRNFLGCTWKKFMKINDHTYWQHYFFEGRDDWKTVRIHPPKLILGNFQGIETGIRQLMRSRPLETERIDIIHGTIL